MDQPDGAARRIRTAADLLRGKIALPPGRAGVGGAGNIADGGGVCADLPGHAPAGPALAEIARMLDLNRSQVFAVGDHLNDLPMLKREFARCIATPANAVPAVVAAVREQGGFISSLAQGRGVREALLHFLNGHL